MESLCSCCDQPCSTKGDTVSCLFMQPLRLMESPLIQEVIILKVSRKFSCAMKTRSYDYLIIIITSNRVLIASYLTARQKCYYLCACACRSRWQEINCKQICLGLVILLPSGRFLSLVCPFYLYNPLLFLCNVICS